MTKTSASALSKSAAAVVVLGMLLISLGVVFAAGLASTPTNVAMCAQDVCRLLRRLQRMWWFGLTIICTGRQRVWKSAGIGTALAGTGASIAIIRGITAVASFWR